MNKSNILKLIGIISMTIDHLGVVLFPEQSWLRVIGRIAMPIFAYQLAIGIRFTSNKKKYLSHLVTFGIIAQIPYMFVFKVTNLNILFSLFYAGLCLGLWQNKKGRWVLPIFIIGSLIIPIEYGIYAVLLPFIFYIGYDYLTNSSIFLLSSTLTIFMSIFYFQWPIQMLAVLGIFLVLYTPNVRIQLRIPKFFFYWYYPLHLIIFLIIVIGI